MKEYGIKARNYQAGEVIQFKVDPAFILADGRTSLMIKNIPNKYSQSLLKETIDLDHLNKFDFLYLPIDFKNKCNVGYAFINMKDPEDVACLYMKFNGKKWVHFNSSKVCEITYARLQGYRAMTKHFSTSTIRQLNDERMKPIIFRH